MEDFDSDTGAEVKTSKYNSAVAQLQRMDKIFEAMHKEVRNGNFFQWNINLDRLWMELVGDLDGDSKEEKDLSIINTEIVALNPLAHASMGTFNKKPPEHTLKMGKQYQLLMKKEKLLRQLQNKLGKGTAWSDPFEDDF